MEKIMKRRKAQKVRLSENYNMSHSDYFIEKYEFFKLGGKHGHKKFHKKGSKTTGYHHKANKDDYHKEKKFYDSEEKKGDHKKYGSEHEYHDSKKGEHKKGEKKGEGYDEGHKGKISRF